MKCKLCGSPDNVDYSVSYGSYLCKVCDSMWKKAVTKVCVSGNSYTIPGDKAKVLLAKNRLKKLGAEHVLYGNSYRVE